jgi:2-dehydro-3-deoxyphosphogluconate aldolase/(4S)-4-hydroxy-2-oxoglutarate aldolase
MAKTCNRRKVAWLPGCGTVSEVSQAEELGAEIVKIFPGKEVGGPGFVKAMLAPCPWSSIMPSGGATPEYEVLKAWIDAGASCIGLGSALTPKNIIAEGNYAFIEDKVKQAIETVKELKEAK